MQESYLVTHGEAAIIRRRAPHVRHESDVREVDEIEPAVENKPAGRPVRGHEVLVALAGESPAVDEEEDENHNNRSEDAPPEFLVHGRFDGLLALHEVAERVVEAVEGPDVEGREGGGEGEDDEEDERAGVLGRDAQRGDGVDDAEDEVGDGQPADVDHRLAQGELHHAVAHADDEEEEEGEAVAEGGEDGDDDQQDFGAGVESVSVLVVVEEPGHEHLYDEEDEDGRDVVLHGEDVVAVQVVENPPADSEQGVDESEGGVEGQFHNLSGGKLAEGIAESDHGFVLLDVVAEGSNAVVAGSLDGVVDRWGVLEVHCHGDDLGS